MARLQSECPDRFTEAQLRTMQRRVKEWRGIMAKKLVYAGTDEASAASSGLPELALIGADFQHFGEAGDRKLSKFLAKCPGGNAAGLPALADPLRGSLGKC